MFRFLIVLGFSHIVLAETGESVPEYLSALRSEGKDEEFAKLMGISDVSLLRADEEKRSENYGVSELGDIFLTPEQKEQSRQGLKWEKYPYSKWDTKVIPYYIFTNDYTPEQVNYIEYSIAIMNATLTNLKFKKWEDGDKDVVVIISGQGCWSYLGRINGGQIMSLQANGCIFTGIIQHEFLHAAGFIHEHSRPDRDYHVEVQEKNIDQAWLGQYQKVSHDDFEIQGKYDCYSVLHYPMRAPGSWKYAFRTKGDCLDFFVGQRWGLTAEDVYKTDILYEY